MELKQTIERLKDSAEFKEWKNTHEDSFLAHAFVMLDEANKDSMQVGFYSNEKQLMSTFIITPDSIAVTHDSEVLKRDGKIRELELDKVKLTIPEALEKAKSIKDEYYPKEQFIKQFFIIQDLDAGPIFNITFITQSFKTLNIKLNANDGTTLKHSLDSLVQMSPGNNN